MTRVTQSMLTTNMLRNLNTSYSKMSKLQDQINTGKVITRASDDPVVAIKGMDYRTELQKNEQYTRNLNEAYSWVDTTDEALSNVTSVLNRVHELVTQAANGTNTSDDRDKISIELNEIRQQLRDVANTQVGGKYIFSGTKTSKALFENGEIADSTIYTGLNKSVQLEVSENVQLSINTDGHTLFGNIDKMLDNLLNGDTGFANASSEELSTQLVNVQATLNATLDIQAGIGAMQNRIDLIQNRLEIQNINITKQMSLNEDTDYSKAITELTTTESIHQAALSVGAKIIQQTLVDFMG